MRVPGSFEQLQRFSVVMVLVALVTAGCGSDAGASAEASVEPEPPESADVESADAGVSFEGETITLVVGYDPGGSYDDAARSLQPYLEDVTGATVVIENMPGAGNLIALNHVWSSDPDGLTIGTLNGPGNTVTVLTDTASEAVQFDLAELSYLVGLTSEPRLMSVASDSPYETFEDLLASDEEVLLGVTGSSGAGYNDAVFMQTVFGDEMESRIVSGFESGAETQLALIAGEVHVNFQLLGGELPAIEAGDIRGLVVLDTERSPALPDVPAIVEYDLSDEARQLLETHITLSKLGIILIAPPGIPADVLTALQDAVYEAATDPELVAAEQESGVAWNPRPAAEIREAVIAALDAPEAYVEMMRAAVAQ